jgi:predicted porin
MKKTLIAMAALGAMAGAAHAQSTVTIYGLLDANFGSYKTNQAEAGRVVGISQTKIDSGGLNGSRWGIRVSEDVGGGMAVIGNLESGVNLDAGSSGQGGLLFGRRANVGITSGFGTVTIGRNSSSYDDVSADHAMMGATLFDPSNTNNGFSTAQAGAYGTVAGNAVLLNHNGNGSGAHVTWVGFNTRFNNSVKYVSPNFSGFSASVMYALGEDKTTTVSASRTTSAYLKYANGPLVVSGGYQSEGATRTAALKPALTNTLLNVSYDFGVAKVGFGANRAKFKDVTTTVGAGGTGVVAAHELAAQKEYSLSVAVPLGATTLSAGYARSKGDDLGTSSGFGVQALYSLSKRTTLYVGAVSTKNYSNVISNTNALAPTSSITRTSTYAAGIRHTF